MLRDLTVTDFLAVLASGAPAPGGGSTAALSGALGASLGAMVTEFSIGKKKYLDHTEALTAARNALHAQQAELAEDIDRDTQAFDAVSAAMKLPKGTPEEMAHRQAEMQKALLGATQSPLAVLERCRAVLAELDDLMGRFNINTASDLGTGVAMVRAGAQGAWLNILINLSRLKDEAQVNALLAKAEGMYREVIRQADGLFGRVEEMCMPKR